MSQISNNNHNFSELCIHGIKTKYRLNNYNLNFVKLKLKQQSLS